MHKLYIMINPFLVFNLVDTSTRSTSKGVLHMANIESVLDNNGKATIYCTSGIVYQTTSKWLTVMALWQKYDREMQETFSDAPVEEDDDDDEVDAEIYGA